MSPSGVTSFHSTPISDHSPSLGRTDHGSREAEQPALHISCLLCSSSTCLCLRPPSLRQGALGVWCGNNWESCSVWWWRHTGGTLPGASGDRDDNRSLQRPTPVPLPLLSHVLGHNPGCYTGDCLLPKPDFLSHPSVLWVSQCCSN